MEFSHVFYKEISLDEGNIFSANLIENNKIDQISFKKSKLYAISGLSIPQDITPNDSLPNVEGKKSLSDILKEETIVFYDYCYHLKYFGFTWEHKPLQLKSEVTLSSDEKTLTRE